jgi:hypothetical protein
MPTYKFAAQVTVSAYTTVEAPNEAAAREVADERSVEFGGLNSGYDENDSWIIDEPDGRPDNIQLSHDHDEDE